MSNNEAGLISIQKIQLEQMILTCVYNVILKYVVVFTSIYITINV